MTYCLFLLFFSSSCKKDAFSGIRGRWMNVAVYTELQNGEFGWYPVERFHEVYHFDSDSRFGAYTDVPGGSGTYKYDRWKGKLELNYEANQYGGTTHTIVLKVEKLAGNNMILAYSSSSGFVYKTEYTRID
ncbi:MAG: hypothetical protein JNK14_02645 [Chitinophagaceae bacterium]|nr:hypothetical protein [Chitinophagaceae bacterium]